MKKKLGVVIATSMQRIESLFSLSLHSVLIQTILPDCIVVVDDNIEDDICSQIDYRVKRDIYNDLALLDIQLKKDKSCATARFYNTLRRYYGW